MRKFWPGPPVAVGEITRTVRDGQPSIRFCACAERAEPGKAGRARDAPMKRRRVGMMPPSISDRLLLSLRGKHA